MPDQSVAGYTEVTWAEDRATRGRDPSAEPGAKTGVGGRTPPLGIPGIGRKAINPITCICISEWRSENRGLSRARRAGKVAGSKVIMPGCMRFWRTTCAALMVLQKRPCFCSPAARPDICPDLQGEQPGGQLVRRQPIARPAAQLLQRERLPGASTTAAPIRSPHSGSGRPTTATSRTAGCSPIASSTSRAETFTRWRTRVPLCANRTPSRTRLPFCAGSGLRELLLFSCHSLFITNHVLSSMTLYKYSYIV